MAVPAKQRILRVAERLFYAEGTKTVGIDRLIEESSVAKATLYRHFSSKDFLVQTYLRTRHDQVIAKQHQVLTDLNGTPQEKILHLFDNLAKKANLPEFRGCAFLLAVAENEGNAEIVNIAREHKDAIKQMFADLSACFTADFESLSDELALCYEGALATISVRRSADGALIARRIAEKLIALYSA